MDVNTRDQDQATPLHLACNLSKLEVVRVLLDHGADARAQNVDSWTPLHQLSLSVIDDYDHAMVSFIVQLLVERGADVNAQDKDQETPLHIACYCGDFDAAQRCLTTVQNSVRRMLMARSRCTRFHDLFLSIKPAMLCSYFWSAAWM